MKIKSLRIKNFRGYYDENCINFDDLTVLDEKIIIHSCREHYDDK